MAKVPQSVAIYARISSDQDGTQLGVNRQLEDCRRLAESLGWGVAEEYVDNDLSAYSGKKRRPDYERMLEDLADRSRDGVLAYHVDRLTRQPKELEQFLEVVTVAGVRHIRFVAGGDLDIASGDGLMVVRMLSAVAANESATKGRRVRRKLDEVAQQGRPHGGTRPYGYEEDRTTVREPEAVVIRTLVERHLAGESLKDLATWLQAEAIPTANGSVWRTTTIRRIIGAARIAGLRKHRGQVIGPAAWAPIITPDQHARIVAMFEDRAVTGRRSPRRYLLSGKLRCGKCGTKLYSSPKQPRRRYVCISGPDHEGCGHLTVVAEPLEDLIVDAVLYRLDTPQLADALTGRTANDERTAAIAEDLANDQAQHDELARLYADKLITAREWIAARNPIEARIEHAQRQLARATRSDALTGLVGNGEALRTQWPTLSLTRQAAIIGAVLDHAIIGPGTSGARVLNPERVRPLWRL